MTCSGRTKPPPEANACAPPAQRRSSPDLADALARQHAWRWSRTSLTAGKQRPRPSRANVQPKQLRQGTPDRHLPAPSSLARADVVTRSRRLISSARSCTSLESLAPASSIVCSISSGVQTGGFGVPPWAKVSGDRRAGPVLGFHTGDCGKLTAGSQHRRCARVLLEIARLRTGPSCPSREGRIVVGRRWPNIRSRPILGSSPRTCAAAADLPGSPR